MPSIRPDVDPFLIVGEVEGPEPVNEADHFARCPICGQAIDCRNLGEVLHHHQPVHDPLPRQ